MGEHHILLRDRNSFRSFTRLCRSFGRHGKGCDQISCPVAGSVMSRFVLLLTGDLDRYADRKGDANSMARFHDLANRLG